ncbi:MAG: hypothetical protein O2807_14070, partial [bacterium]|nr:hypothetical protein [bacterium]
MTSAPVMDFLRRFRHPPRRPAPSWLGVIVRLVALGMILLYWLAFGFGCARKPAPLPSAAAPKTPREAQIARYGKTLRAFMEKSDTPLIDLALTLKAETDTDALIRQMDREDVALAAVTAPDARTIAEAVRRHPGRLIPLTAAGSGVEGARPDGAFLERTRSQLASGAFGIGLIPLRIHPPEGEKSEKPGVPPLRGGVFEKLIALAVEKSAPLIIRMDPDDAAAGELEALLRAHPAARVLWTGAGYLPQVDEMPGYGHALLRAMSLRHGNLFFAPTLRLSEKAYIDVRHRPILLYDSSGQLSFEWQTLMDARAGQFAAASRHAGA